MSTKPRRHVEKRGPTEFRDPVIKEELKRAKAKVVGQKKIARQDVGNYAMVCALDELYGLGFERSDRDDAEYEAVTLQDVKRVTAKVLAEDKFVISVVGPAK